MSSSSSIHTQSERTDKGKGRAKSPELSTERTPLLASQSSSAVPLDDPETTSHSRPRLWFRLTYVFFASLVVCIVIVILLALVGYSYAAQASKVTPEDILNHSLVLKGPDRIDVLNMTGDGGIWVEVEGRVGLDVGSVIGVNDGEDDNEWVWTKVWKAIGRWGVRSLDKVTVNLSTIQLYSERDHTTVLASLGTPPLTIPLTANPPSDLSWLTTMNVTVLIRPTDNFTAVTNYLQDAWRDGILAVRAEVSEAAVQGGSLRDRSWRQRFALKRSDVKTSIRMQIPPLPGLPHPGRHSPFPKFSELVTLKSFNIYTVADNLSLRAQATVLDPVPISFNFTSPAMPFTISLPLEGKTDLPAIPIASVHTEPFSLTHPNITLSILGKVLPLEPSYSSTLSAFLSSYLSARSNPIIISTPLFPGLSIDTVFPGPVPKPKVLRNVTIHDMKIKPHGSKFLASGTIFARVVLPKGMNIEVDVNRVFPDVLIFDGEVPDSIPPPERDNHRRGDAQPPSTPLPDPLPERAFGHVRPDDWLVSLSEPTEPEDGEGAAYTVTAGIVDAPLDILPGRDKEFRSFMAKVVFGTQGAVAGLLGSVAVSVDVHGLPLDNGSGHKSEMELTGLPFQGSVRIGKKGMIMEEKDMYL